MFIKKNLLCALLFSALLFSSRLKAPARTYAEMGSIQKRLHITGIVVFAAGMIISGSIGHTLGINTYCPIDYPEMIEDYTGRLKCKNPESENTVNVVKDYLPLYRQCMLAVIACAPVTLAGLITICATCPGRTGCR